MRTGSPQVTPPQDRESLPTFVKGLHPLPEDYWQAIRAGLPAISGDSGSGDDSAVSEAQLQTIGDHVRLLMAWNGAINLSGIRAPELIARDQVLDSLTALPLLRRAGVEEFLDIGSGGGFPGLPLAVALPARRAVLVESVGKKARRDRRRNTRRNPCRRSAPPRPMAGSLGASGGRHDRPGRIGLAATPNRRAPRSLEAAAHQR